MRKKKQKAPMEMEDSTETSAENVLKLFKEKIASGKIAYGELLPKKENWMQEYGVSNRTFAIVKRRLTSLGLILKKGRRYWVGRIGMGTVKTPLSQKIVIICKNEGSWEYYYNHDRYGLFCQTFVNEGEGKNIQIKFIFFNQLKLSELKDFKNEVSQIFDSLHDIRAVLFFALKFEIESLSPHLRFIGNLPFPKIWFDRKTKAY